MLRARVFTLKSKKKMANFHTENIASILNKFDSNMDQGLSAEALEKAKSAIRQKRVCFREKNISA